MNRRLASALRRAVCLRDELPANALFTWASRLPFLEIPWALVTISPGSAVVRRGESTRLSGKVVSARASERVTIYARRGSASAFTKIGSTSVGPDGSWSINVTPSATTSYRAVSKSAASRVVAVRTRGK